MDTKIQELTDKIYNEGVEKGNEEAGRIIAEANAQKDTIIKDAEAEAKRIVAAAEKQAAELKKKTEGKKASFSIIPADGSYKVTFGEDEFIEFFKEFLRPQLVEMLF